MTKKHDIIWLESVDSTNNEAARRLYNLDNLSVLSALSQTSGRGQRGNAWLSDPGANLIFSIILKYNNPPLPIFPAADQTAISALTVITVVELLSTYGINASIKLPNDIYVGDKKICGILIEHAVKGEFLTHSIVGIGLNINQCEFDHSLPNPTSLALCLKDVKKQISNISIKDCLNLFMDIYKKNLHQFIISGDYVRLQDSMSALLR